MYINYNDTFITYSYCLFLVFFYVAVIQIFCFLRYVFVKYLSCYI
jgi:hypothetical protein